MNWRRCSVDGIRDFELRPRDPRLFGALLRWELMVVDAPVNTTAFTESYFDASAGAALLNPSTIGRGSKYTRMDLI